MIIRDGFVTNSSSTNFMIISKEELSSDYLLEKLGFRKGSRISAAAFSLVDDIVSATKSGVRWFEVDQINYENILKIVPNYTTSGYALTDKEIELTKKYCGAVAVSYYSKLDKYGNEDNPSTISALERFVKAGCITNVHYVLSKKSIKEAIYRVKNGVFPKGINAVVFFFFFPIGLASRKHVIDCGDPDYLELLRLVASADSSWRYGFDTCQSPAIYKFASSIAIESIEFCEAARFSMYINSRCIAFPCSFGIEDDTFSVDLKQHTLREAWESESFAKFRKQQSEMCSNCNAGVCRSCGLGLEINLCGKVKKYL